ncbi:MAG: hemolysin family protein [candidate division WOR-3 bacterium]
MIFYIIAILILLFFSFVFSGSETAFFAITKSMREKIKEDYYFVIRESRHVGFGIEKEAPSNINLIESLLRNPSALLATILFSNLIVNTSASSLFTLLIITLSNNYHLPRDLFITIGGIIMTLLIITVGEITPKIFALRDPSKFALKFAWIINLFSKILIFVTYPLRKIGDWLIIVLNRYIHRSPFPSEDDLKTIIELSKQQGIIVDDEEDFLKNLVDLSHRQVSEIMTPRIQMICLKYDLKVKEAIKILSDNDIRLVSRIPIYADSIDNIVGVLYLKDLVKITRTRNLGNLEIGKIARPAYFVPENKPLSELLAELRRKDSHIAIVVDEFGQTAGLVTLEDILEALLGEIQDEYDSVAEVPYKKISENSYLVSGDIDLKAIDRLFPNFSLEIPIQAGYRLSGFIHHVWGRIPKIGEVLYYKDYKLEIKEVSKKRIDKIIISKIRK